MTEGGESDEELMLRIQNGDHKAFTVLLRRHVDKFYGLAWSMTGRLPGYAQEAEDIVQDAFVKLWQQPRSFDTERGVKFTTWFYRVIVNLSLDRLRQRQKTIFLTTPELIVSSAPSQQDVYDATERQIILEQAIQTLPEKQKAALNLCFYEGISNNEAASIMGISIKALESLLMRAKAKLKDQLIRQGVLENDK